MSHDLHMFDYVRISHLGEISKGYILALNVNDAIDKIRRQGFIVRRISKRRNLFHHLCKKKIRHQDVTIFAQQIATTVNIGIPLKQALEQIINNQTNQSLRMLLQLITQDIESGLMFSEALCKYPKVFNSFFCSLVAIGEGTGRLDIMLEKVASYLVNKEKIRAKLKKAITYPLILIVLAVIIGIGVIVYIVPEFESLFDSFNATLPFVTILIINMSKFMNLYSGYIVTLGIFTILTLCYLYKYCQIFTIFIDRLFLVLPVFGVLIQKIILSRLTNALSVSLSAGIPLVESLKLTTSLIFNKTYLNAFSILISKVSQGEQLQIAMKSTSLFPDFVINMISLGDESGSMEVMLKYVANYYDQDVETSISTLSNLLEPIIMTILGIIVGGLVLAIYFPILKLGSVV